MARCPTCGNSDVAAGCLCSFENTDCVAVTGSGSPTVPFTIDLQLDPDADNILTCGVNGLMGEVPATVTNPPRGRAYRTTTLAVSSGVLTAVPLLAEDYDTDAMHAASSSQVVAVNPGIYHFDYTAQFVGNGSTTGKNQVVPRVNGADPVGAPGVQTSDTPSAAETTYLTGAVDLNLGAGDYFELYVAQTSGSPKDVGSASVNWHYVGPTP